MGWKNTYLPDGEVNLITKALVTNWLLSFYQNLGGINIMEQNSSNNPSNTSPPAKRSKLQQEEKSSITDTTSNHASSSAMNLNPANVEHTQQP